MNKKHKVSLIAIFTTALAVLLMAVCLLTARPTAAFAADRYVTVDGSNIFYTTIRGAEVTDGIETDPEDEETEYHYTLFKIGHDETVAYRKSLAYSWISGADFMDDKGNPTGGYAQKSFSMTIGFDSLNFEKYIIAFQSQQYLKTEDKITKNYLVFAPGEDGKVDIATVKNIDEEVSSYPVSCETANHARITIKFASYSEGVVTLSISVKVNGEEKEVSGDQSKLTFKNVYYPYANYVSSGDNAVIPLTFTAKFAEDAKPEEGVDELTADMKLYDLNGQSFRLYNHDNDGLFNDVRDEAPPALCFTKTPAYAQFGKSLDFSYQVIDVLATSPRATANFYVLKGEQYEADDFNYMQIEHEEESKKDEDNEGDGEEGGEEDGEKGEEVKNYPDFIKVSSGSDIRVMWDEKTFVPSKYLEGGSEYSENYSVYGLIKIYYELSDVTGSMAKTDKVFVDWYAKEEAIVNIFSEEYKNTDLSEKDEYYKNTGNFLKIIDGKDGVTYAAKGVTNLDEYKETIKSIQEKYQKKIDEAVAELEGGKLYAGGESNFYLPAFDIFECDDYFNLRDYKFSIYYKGKTTGTSTSLDFNNLSFPLNDADATYRFTVYVTDSFGNPMRYPDVDNEGNLIWKDITTNDIWDEDFALLLPFFEIDVSYKKATAKNPESLSVAYVGTSYSGVSFDIKDSANTATATYNLYIFDRNGAYRDLNLDLNYSEFVENYEKLFGNTYLDGTNTRKYFKTVRPSTELKEGDKDYDLFKAINWNAKNVTFTPQSVDDFYVVRLSLLDNRSQTSDTYFATVAASIKANPLKGETEWLKNNVAAIILLSIAGVLFIAFVVLLVIKPKDKGDIDEIYENNKKDKKDKKVKSK